MNILQKIANWAFEIKINCIGCGEEIEVTDGIPFCQSCKKNMNITISEDQCNEGECNHEHPESFVAKPVGKDPEIGYR